MYIFIIFTESPEGNTCGISSSICNLKLQPENLCIKSCDLEIYVQIDGICATCIYFKSQNKVSGEFKFVNSTQCIENKPDNSIYYNEKNKILKCDKGYKLDETTLTCIPNCYELCTTCNDFSNDPLHQECKSCITGYNLNNENNCIKIVPTTIPMIIPTTIMTKTQTSTLYKAKLNGHDGKISLTWEEDIIERAVWTDSGSDVSFSELAISIAEETGQNPVEVDAADMKKKGSSEAERMGRGDVAYVWNIEGRTILLFQDKTVEVYFS